MNSPKSASAPAEPLNDTWWFAEESGGYPPSDAPILAPYDKTRPGFEWIRAGVCEDGLVGEHFKDVGDGFFEVCLWDIWRWAKGEKKGKPLPDPAETDPKKQAINAMQAALGELSDEDRLIRIQSACLVRCHYTFPRNIDIVIDGIASGRVNLDTRISCEPPWNNSLLPLLRHRRQDSARESDGYPGRWSLVRAYMTILDGYLGDGSLDSLREILPDHTELAEALYRRLGAPTPKKRAQVTRLHNALTLWAFRRGPGPEAHNSCLQIDEALAGVAKGDSDSDDEFGKLIKKLHQGLCHQFFFRRVDHLIAYIGKGRRCELPDAGEGRQFVTETLVSYIHALGSWLSGRSVEDTARIWPPCEQTAEQVFTKLGEPSPRKRWLAACLWKNLQEIQSWAGRGAFDEDPERFAVSKDALTA